MKTVRILHGEVGQYKEGDIVQDAPPGLVNIALNETRNAATGELIAVIVDVPFDGAQTAPADWEQSVHNLIAELEASRSREAELQAKLEAKEGADDELKELKAAAKELKIAGYTKMAVVELKAAIAAAEAANGGGEGAE